MLGKSRLRSIFYAYICNILLILFTLRCQTIRYCHTMSHDKFTFKCFEVHQDRCAMKVGTDSVLLGAWLDIPPSGTILDIGTGTGILPLMVAQRDETVQITAIEIDKQAALQAQENIERSMWRSRIEVVHADFTQVAASLNKKYDCIISNPPYFQQSLLSPDEARTVARHTTALSFDSIFSLSREIVTAGGRLSLVIPANLYNEVNHTAMLYGWGATRLTHVRTTTRKQPKRVLCEWQRNYFSACTEDTITIHVPSGEYSEQYIALTRNFYLHF